MHLRIASNETGPQDTGHAEILSWGYLCACLSTVFLQLAKHLIKANPTILALAFTITRLIHTFVILSSTGGSAISKSPDAVLLVDLPRLCEQEFDSVRILLGNLHDLALQACNSTLD